MGNYYRYRSAERLLGRASTEEVSSTPGELDDLTIYFASPEELNDPLEGHRETYFHGDIIVWRNLLKHYTLTLFAMTINVYTGNEEVLQVQINLRPENFPEQSLTLLNETIDTVLACTELKSYLDAIASADRSVSRLELSVHLATLHNAVLAHILQKLESPLTIPGVQSFRDMLPRVLEFIAMRSAEIREQGNSSNISDYSKLKAKINQQALRAYAARDTDLSKAQIRLLVGYPDEFCLKLEYLMYPAWHVACFMRTCSNSSIWGSYGDNHKGICLIYKTQKYRGADCLTISNLPFEFVKAYNTGRPKNEYYLLMPLQLPLVEVSYNASYAKPNFFTSLMNGQMEWALSYWYTDEAGNTSACAEWLDQKPSQIFPQYLKDFQKSCTTKTAHWENETESRIILSGLNWEREEKFARYSFSELEGLIFGINTSDETKVKVIRKIATHCANHRRSDFKFYQARFNDTYSAIEHEHLEYIKFNSDGTLNLDASMK